MIVYFLFCSNCSDKNRTSLGFTSFERFGLVLLVLLQLLLNLR